MRSKEVIEETAAAWRQTIENGQEAGERPSIHIGESSSLVDGIAALTACRLLAHTRADLTSPRLLVGGSSPLWSAFLLHGVDASTRSMGTPSPAMTAVYAGADAATVMATATVEESGAATPATLHWSRVPAGMVSRMMPISAGPIRLWESLPLFTMERPSPIPEEVASTNWTAYAALVLAVCILLLALFV